MKIEERILAQLNYKISEHLKVAADNQRQAQTLEDFKRYVERQIDDENARLKREEAKAEAVCVAELN